MKRFLDGKIARLFLFLALIPLISGKIENAIICIEENGRIAIESPKNGECGADGLSEYANEHCSGCTDIQIFNSTEGVNLNSFTKIKNTLAIANIHYLADSPRLSLGNYVNLSESSVSSHDFLRSVIIRI